jgi:hypothetical protein
MPPIEGMIGLDMHDWPSRLGAAVTEPSRRLQPPTKELK